MKQESQNKYISLLNNLNLNNYFFEFTPTEGDFFQGRGGYNFHINKFKSKMFNNKKSL